MGLQPNSPTLSAAYVSHNTTFLMENLPQEQLQLIKVQSTVLIFLQTYIATNLTTLKGATYAQMFYCCYQNSKPT